jgi:hypothetical protein
MKMNLKIISAVVVFLTALVFVAGCKKKYDLPPVKAAPAVSGYISIDSIHGRYGKHYITSAATSLYRFKGDVNLECTVTADESSGNIYKTVYVEDGSTAGLQVKLINTGGLAVGDKIRINLNNVVLDNYGGVAQLDSIDIEKSVVKLSSGNTVTPTKMTYNQMKANNIFGYLKYQSRLITLDTVEFSNADKNQPFADPINKFSLDRTLLTATGSTIDVRSSGYSNFAGSLIPCGKGSLTSILGQFSTSIQLTIRNYNEVKLASAGCPLIFKSFDDGSISSGGWTNYKVLGTINWTYETFSGQSYGQISNYVSGSNYACETWLISPAFDISNGTNPRFSFRSAYNYTGPALQVLVSTNYNSGDPNLATWTTLSPNLSSGGWSWANSGAVLLGLFKTPNTRIAFKYTGTATSGSTWEIDDIAIFAD